MKLETFVDYEKVPNKYKAVFFRQCHTYLNNMVHTTTKKTKLRWFNGLFSPIGNCTVARSQICFLFLIIKHNTGNNNENKNHKSIQSEKMPYSQTCPKSVKSRGYNVQKNLSQGSQAGNLTSISYYKRYTK